MSVHVCDDNEPGSIVGKDSALNPCFLSLQLYTTQAGLELLGSSDPPDSGACGPGTTTVNQWDRPCFQ